MNTTDRPSLASRRVSRRGLLGGAAALLAAVGGGTAWALDRFIIEHPQVTDASSQWQAAASGSGTVSGTRYTGSGATIEISSHTSGSGSDTLTWYVADVHLNGPESLRTAFAKDTYGENIIETPSTIAAANFRGIRDQR